MENNITIKQLQESINKNNITSWSPRCCSICNAPLSYYFTNNQEVYFDSSCDCTIWHSDPRLTNLEELIQIYNRADKQFKNEFKEYFCL